MFPEQEEVLRKASCLDLSKLKTEILASPSIPEEFKIQSDNLLTEYRRFLVLKVIFGDTSLPLSFSPSAIIDQVWHLHLLTPVHYIKCCKLLGDEVLDHDPSASRDRLELRQKRLEMTKRSYKIAFGEDPPKKFWAFNYQFSPQQDVSECPSELEGGRNIKSSHENLLSKMYRPKILALTYQPSTRKRENSENNERKENHKSESDGEGSQNTESDEEENRNKASDEEESLNSKIDEEESQNMESYDDESRNSESDEEENPDIGGEDFINIRVHDGNKLINFKMRRSTRMKNLIDSIEKMGYGKYMSTFRLLFDGCLNNFDTPESLKMKDGDVILMLAVQSGC